MKSIACFAASGAADCASKNLRRTCALSRAPDNAHTRRGFFDALGSDEVAARTALDFILEIYKVEERAKETGIAGTAEHLTLRQTISRKVMDEFKAWLDAEKPKHLPKGPMGAAIGYALTGTRASSSLAGLYSLVATCQANDVT